MNALKYRSHKTGLLQEPNLSRGPHVSIFVLFYFDLFWVWAENSHFSPPTQLPMHLNYLCLCRLHWSSLPILPYMPIVLFSLLLGGNTFFWWACSPQLPLIVSLKYKPRFWYKTSGSKSQSFDTTSRSIGHSLHGDLSDRGKDKTDTLVSSS